MHSCGVSGWLRSRSVALSIAAALLGGCGGRVVVPGEAAGTTTGVGGAATASVGAGGSIDGGCPPTFPAGTGPCKHSGLECTYADGAYGGCASRWVCAPNPELGGLTWGPLLPDLGTSCDLVGRVCWYWSCLYPPASTSLNITARCDASHTWKIEHSSLPQDVGCELCNHPFNYGEPCDLGRDYAMCSTVVGLTCGVALFDIACVPAPGGAGVIATSYASCP